MSPLNPIFAFIVYFISYATTYIFNTKHLKRNDSLSFDTIDGLRGFLAIGVFIHHSYIWYQYLQTNSWKAPDSNLYNQLGETSVSLFFMITAFLFSTKLLNTNVGKIDWYTIFISRFFRLAPMYFVSISILILIIFTISNWVLNVSITKFLIELFCWATFTIIYRPDINNFIHTNLINAGVVWSLSYEWLFYASLPILSILLLKKKTSTIYVTLSVLFVFIYFIVHNINYNHLLSFFGGIITSLIIKHNSKRINFNSKINSIIILLCLFIMLLFRSPDNYICKILLTIIFILIALGNDFFGILKSSRLKLLGDISYSIYLIHGIIIFIIMFFYFNLDKAKQLSSTNFCITIFIITPIIVITSYLTHKYIEMPFINYSKKIKKR